MADEEQDVEVEQVAVVPPTFPIMNSLDEFKSNVEADEEFLVVVVVTSSLCQFSNQIKPFLVALSEPKPQTSKARFVQVVVPGPGGEEIFSYLKLTRTPSILFYLKGGQRGQTFHGSNKDKIEGLFRNELISRNEEMREYDEAKAAAMQPVEEHGDEEAEEPEDPEA